VGDDYCYSINTWQEFEAAYTYDYSTPITETSGAQQYSVHQAIEYERAYRQFWSDPITYLADATPANKTRLYANAFATLFLGRDLLASDERTDYLILGLSEKSSLTEQEQCAFFALGTALRARQYDPDRGSSGGGYGNSIRPNPSFTKFLPDGSGIDAILDESGVMWTAIEVKVKR
jgi:hypothetical protein